MVIHLVQPLKTRFIAEKHLYINMYVCIYIYIYIYSIFRKLPIHQAIKYLCLEAKSFSFQYLGLLIILSQQLGTSCTVRGCFFFLPSIKSNMIPVWFFVLPDNTTISENNLSGTLLSLMTLFAIHMNRIWLTKYVLQVLSKQDILFLKGPHSPSGLLGPYCLLGGGSDCGPSTVLCSAVNTILWTQYRTCHIVGCIAWSVGMKGTV